MKSNKLNLEVWGNLACFSNPVMKVERFSYEIITPSAARGIFEAIYWKSKFRWQVTAIETRSKLEYISLRRNEVKDKAPSQSTIIRWSEGGADPEPILADGDGLLLGTDQKGRTQRQTMALKNAHYLIQAEIRPWPEYEMELPAMEAQFRRRAKAGQCIYQPFFGCKEFPAYFSLYEGDLIGSDLIPNKDMGWMLYDVYDLSSPGSSNEQPFITVFKARIINSILQVPDYESDHVRKPERSV